MSNLNKGKVLKKCILISENDLYYFFQNHDHQDIDIIMPKEFAKKKYKEKDTADLKIYHTGTSPSGSPGVFVKSRWFPF